MNQASISTLSIPHLKCFSKYVLVDLLCVKRLLMSQAHSWKMVTRELSLMHLHTYATSMSINKRNSPGVHRGSVTSLNVRAYIFFIRGGVLTM